MSVLGFFFWMINARLFTTEQVGLATTLISVLSLVTGLSLFGLNVGLIRYLPKAQSKSNKINTAFTFVSLLAVIVTSVYLIGIQKFSPDLVFLRENLIVAFVFILFVIFSALASLIDSIFIAYRSTKFILIKNTIFSSLKLIFPFFFVFLGAYGIFTSWMISLIIAVFVSIGILMFKFDYKPKFVLHDSIMRKIGGYSFGNYIAGFIGGLPIMVLPIIILNNLGAESVAYYYMAMMVATLLFTIPQATSQSLFAEGSHNDSDDELKKQVKKALKIIGVILIPGILFTIFFGQYILMLFGKEYATEGFRFLQLLAVSGVFVGLNSMGENLLRVKKKIKSLVIINSLRAILIIGGISLLLSKGIMGVGYGWLIGQLLITLIYVGVFGFRKK